MRLYVANCTLQTMNLHYRLDFNAQGEREANGRFQPAKQQEIPSGKQVQIGSDFHIRQIEDIVQQLEKYGLAGCVDVPRLQSSFKKLDPNSRKPTPMVFNVDQPVPRKTIETVVALNKGILREQGTVRRQNAAVAVNDIVHNRVNEEMMARGVEAAPVGDVEVGFEQLEQSNLGESTIAEGYKMGEHGQAPGSTSARTGRRGPGRSRKGM